MFAMSYCFCSLKVIWMKNGQKIARSAPLLQRNTRSAPLRERITRTVPLQERITRTVPLKERITSTVPLKERIARSVSITEVQKPDELNLVLANLTLEDQGEYQCQGRSAMYYMYVKCRIWSL